jgi:hypothetical protein
MSPGAQAKTSIVRSQKLAQNVSIIPYNRKLSRL